MNLKSILIKRYVDFVVGTPSAIVTDHAAVESPVAFYSVLQISQLHIHINENIKFGYPVLNIGNGYNPETGVFTAPRAGIYQIAVSLSSYKNLGADIAINGQALARIVADPVTEHFDQGSQTLVLQLQVNDTVYVRNMFNQNASVSGGLYSSFSGTLLHDIWSDADWLNTYKSRLNKIV